MTSVWPASVASTCPVVAFHTRSDTAPSLAFVRIHLQLRGPLGCAGPKNNTAQCHIDRFGKFSAAFHQTVSSKRRSLTRPPGAHAAPSQPPRRDLAPHGGQLARVNNLSVDGDRHSSIGSEDRDRAEKQSRFLLVSGPSRPTCPEHRLCRRECFQEHNRCLFSRRAGHVDRFRQFNGAFVSGRTD